MKKTYTAVCQRSQGWWAIRFPEVPGAFSQARRLGQVERMVRDRPHDRPAVEIGWHVVSPLIQTDAVLEGTSVDAVVFDFYDTLGWVDWPRLRGDRARLAERAGADAECMQQQWDRTIAARSIGCMGQPEQELAQLLEACGVGADAGSLKELVALDGENWQRCVHLFDDVRRGLDCLRERGFGLAIVSNCSWQTSGVLRALGLDRQVDVIVLSFEVRSMKPDPAMLALVCERLEVSPERMVLVDDVVENLDAARRLRAGTLLIDRMDRAPDGDHRPVRDLSGVVAALL